MGRGKLQNHRGEHSNRGAEGKAERFPHRGSVATSTHQPKTLVCSPTREAWALEVRPQGEGWGWLHEHSLKGESAPQLAGRESGKMSGAAREARNHCFGVRKERGFLLRVPTDGRALPKQAPEKGTSHSYLLGPQRRAQTTTAVAAATKNPVCKRRSLPTTPWESVRPATARVL